MTNEPTTGEIVRALREPEAFCEGCNHHGEPNGCNMNGIGCKAWDHAQEADDRLESQDKQIAELSSNCDCIMEAFMSICTVAFKMSAKSAEKDTTIKELTARAESAEAERDAAIKDIRKQCETCFHHSTDDIPHCTIGVNGKCYFGGYDYWQWRGLQPQDGGGK